MAESDGAADRVVQPPRVSKEEILASLRKVLLKQTGLDGENWNEQTPLKETGINSFDAIECIFELEDEFKVDLDFNANDPKIKMETIGDLVNLFVRRFEAEAPR